MSEHDFDDWLRDKMENDTVSSEYKFTTSSATRENQVTEPTRTLLLPLSLENNASVSGTASVLEEFGRQFKIPCDHAKLVLQYDEHLTLTAHENTMSSCICCRSTRRKWKNFNCN